MNETKIKEFAEKNAPYLAEQMTRMCGKIIERGLTGILTQCIEMQERIDALEAELEFLKNKLLLSTPSEVCCGKFDACDRQCLPLVRALRIENTALKAERLSLIAKMVNDATQKNT